MNALSESTLFAAAALVGARVLGIFLAAPFFRGRGMPWRLKIGVLGLLSICLLSSPVVAKSLFDSAPELLPRLTRVVDGWLLLATETLVGMILGWSTLVVLAIVRAAANIISQQAGFSAAAIADPQGAGTDTTLRFFFDGLTVFLFLALDLHHSLIRALVDSYASVPPGSLSLSTLPALLEPLLLNVGQGLIAGAFVLAFPVCLALGIVSLGQGILGRILPEAEVFTLGLPVRVFVAIVVIVVGLPAMSGYVRLLLEGAIADGAVVLRGMGG
jgi:flagellar biosynthetic protein FliR